MSTASQELILHGSRQHTLNGAIFRTSPPILTVHGTFVYSETRFKVVPKDITGMRLLCKYHSQNYARDGGSILSYLPYHKTHQSIHF